MIIYVLCAILHVMCLPFKFAFFFIKTKNCEKSKGRKFRQVENFSVRKIELAELIIECHEMVIPTFLIKLNA